VADRQSVNAAFSFDVSEIRKEVYYKYGRNAVKWLVEELTAGVSDSAKIAQAEANARIKGGSGSKLAQASKVVTRSSAKEIEGKVDWDSARSAAGFPYAAAVDKGRKAFGPKTAQYLRFEIDGEVIYTKWVKAAPAQDFTGKGLAAAKPKILGRMNAGVAKWAIRMATS
jgi:hypothetical protein